MRHARFPLALSLAAMLVACGDSDDDAPASQADVVDLAGANPQLSVLAEAVTAAGLDGALAGEGPFTVFAPTNDAFASLLDELGVTKAELLANQELLTTVLRYHVVAGRALAADIQPGKAVTPLEGGYFKIDDSGGGLVVTDGRNRTSNVTATDIAAANGVVHVIDRVLLPADRTVLETAAADGRFTILVEAVTAAGLDEALSGPGPFTVFAPTDAAFAALLEELDVTQAQLLADTALLSKVLAYHVIPALVLKADVVPGVQPPTVAGETFSIDASLVVTDQRDRTANLVATDVLASNGVVHVLDRVILPAP